MANTRETMGEQACLDALVARTLTSFEDDGITKVGMYCLQHCPTLTDVKLSACRDVDSQGITDCPNLEVVDIQGTGTINNNAFNGDYRLAHLLLRGSTMTTLSSISAFNSTPIIAKRGAVYVDAELVDTYKSNNTWRPLVFLPLSAYPTTDLATISDSWSTIISKAQDGTAAQSYSVGDTKLLDVGTEGKVYAQVAKVDSTGITFITRDTLKTLQKMNPSSSTVGGWASSSIRTYLNTTVFNLLPADIQAAIKSVTKYTRNYADGAVVNDQETTDKLWLPSAKEIFGGTGYETQGEQYNGITLIKYDSTYSPRQWWLRTTHNAKNFYYINMTGGIGNQQAGSNYGVSFGFCI